LAELARDARAQPGCALKQQLARGVTHRVEVFDAGAKGFGVQARENIEQGVAVMEYVGENVPAHAMGERDLQVNLLLHPSLHQLPPSRCAGADD
jgi:hypothetical protein